MVTKNEIDRNHQFNLTADHNVWQERNTSMQTRLINSSVDEPKKYILECVYKISKINAALVTVF